MMINVGNKLFMQEMRRKCHFYKVFIICFVAMVTTKMSFYKVFIFWFVAMVTMKLHFYKLNFNPLVVFFCFLLPQQPLFAFYAYFKCFYLFVLSVAIVTMKYHFYAK